MSAGILGSGQVDIDGLGAVFILVFVAAAVSAVASVGIRPRADTSPLVSA